MGRGVELGRRRDSGRDGIIGPRKRGDIGFTAICGGDIRGRAMNVCFASQMANGIHRSCARCDRIAAFFFAARCAEAAIFGGRIGRRRHL